MKSPTSSGLGAEPFAKKDWIEAGGTSVPVLGAPHSCKSGRCSAPLVAAAGACSGRTQRLQQPSSAVPGPAAARW
jgi:hypothetical protein